MNPLNAIDAMITIIENGMLILNVLANPAILTQDLYAQHVIIHGILF